MYPDRVVSGMRPTGLLHLGHYHGALKNWIRMQSELPCLFFVADWHAPTTHYDGPAIIEKHTWDMVVDWLAAGIGMMREIARRFNHLYGKEPDFEQKALDAVSKLGSKRARLYAELRTAYRQEGDAAALEQAQAMLDDAGSLSNIDRERLFGYLEGGHKIILVEPQVTLAEASRLPGLDGRKMSKSYANAIALREDPAGVTRKIRTMPTDPARVHRTDPGDPLKCPVWRLHEVYSGASTKDWVVKGCTGAGIGCLECKQPVIDAVLAEQAPVRERAQPYLDDPSLVRAIVADGCDKARKLAQETMRDVREAMGLSYG
ncbi:tryptophan--tRNA ligase [Massilia sp. 9096]|uniref:tryptophan--tRNA ligase n=1 Tax=Massilia sp. 9096 TaxID=1500894 RepID=UPI00056A1BAD|nr:tryptophan--tRNA ligase [Massilia sp. 9096]